LNILRWAFCIVHCAFRNGGVESIAIVASGRGVTQALSLCLPRFPAYLQTILPSVLKARPSMLLIEGANPRHEHEWEIWTSRELPDDKVLVPGVIDTSTNYAEHPELVA
jgi:methionine synthase II (cobalamin-independent)